MAHPTWPLFDLCVRTPRLELRLPTDDELGELIPQADSSIHDHLGFMPFHVDWTGDAPASMQYHWGARANWKPTAWSLPLTPFVDGRPLGTQSIEATNFATLRAVSTGSWIVRSAQGLGFGREMRAAALHLVFAGLGALEAHSEAHVDNAGSNRISELLGYEQTHVCGSLFGDERGLITNLMLTREVWQTVRRDDIEIEGLDSCRDMFGL